MQKFRVKSAIQQRRARVILALAGLTMFVLSAGAPGATGWR